MNIKIVEDIAIINDKRIIIKNVQSAIDLMMNVKYEANCNKIILNKDAIVEKNFYSKYRLSRRNFTKIY